MVPLLIPDTQLERRIPMDEAQSTNEALFRQEPNLQRRYIAQREVHLWLQTDTIPQIDYDDHDLSRHTDYGQSKFTYPLNDLRHAITLTTRRQLTNQALRPFENSGIKTYWRRRH
jgi:hypothetical protein